MTTTGSTVITGCRTTVVLSTQHPIDPSVDQSNSSHPIPVALSVVRRSLWVAEPAMRMSYAQVLQTPGRLSPSIGAHVGQNARMPESNGACGKLRRRCCAETQHADVWWPVYNTGAFREKTECVGDIRIDRTGIRAMLAVSVCISRS
jgi:hypothetical protein